MNRRLHIASSVHQGRQLSAGLRAALLESLRRLRARGMDRVVISTGESNTPARRLYESFGLTAVSAYFDYAKSA